MTKAAFIDRDGTVNIDFGYISSPDMVVLMPDAAKGLKRLHDKGYLIIIVSNQSGVARGYFTEEDVVRVNLRILELVRLEGADIDGFYFCPHHPQEGFFPYLKDCKCRKPKPGLVKRAVRDFDINLKRSIVIGDKESDIKLALNLNILGILLGDELCNSEGEGKNWIRLHDWNELDMNRIEILKEELT
ncbi:MAG: HAD family hydrolase [Candidatus Coatesbacteria bacterium]|nr:HAD family hydrolase [Candidatus Coatesbacteria bacterium]